MSAYGNERLKGGDPKPRAENLVALRDYVLNPAFRSAEGHELLFTDNPFHRPVRPNDLDFVDFSHPLSLERCSELSALMGQRILLNIYEADHPFITDKPLSPQAIRDRESFYSAENRLKAEAVRPFLERYLFAWADADDDEREGTLGRVLDDQLAHAVNSAARLFEAIECSTDRPRMARFAAIEMAGAAFSKELAIGRWSCVDWGGPVAGFIAACAESARQAQADLMNLSSACGLLVGPHIYWQFYLAPWIGVSNYLHRCTRDPRRIDEALGAVLFDRLRFAAIATRWRDTLTRLLEIAPPPSLFARLTEADAKQLRAQALNLLTARAARDGQDVLRAAMRGIVGMQRIWSAADRDFATQCSWAGQADRYRAVAERYSDIIRRHELKIDMETYDEHSSERSTTHVHDTDRLLVIESGEMDFWHSFGPPMHFAPGDMIFVPRHRLHGSVVTSDRCLYHQPIITAEFLRAYDGK